MLTPINMISFLLSLFLIDHSERQWRLSQHATKPSTIWARFDPQPYQARDATWRHSSASPARHATDHSYTGWYRYKLDRAMTKLEINDAFEMRGRVIVALLAWSLLGVLSIVYVVRHVYLWVYA